MKAFLILPIFCFLCSSVFGQQRPQLTQYVQNNFLANPAVAGVEEYGDVRMGYRSQWLGIERAPATFYVSAHAALNKNDRNVSPLRLKHNGAAVKGNGNRNNRFYRKPHHGVGVIAQTDKAGIIRASALNLSYAYHLPVTQSASLSGGVYTGFTQLNINHNLFLQTQDDPLLYADMENLLRMDLGLGLWLYSEDYFVGVSGMQLAGIRKKSAPAGDGPQALLQPHYYITGGYRMQVSRELALAPSLMIKTAASGQTAVDVNLKALHGNGFWCGMSYRHQDAVAGMVGVYLNHVFDVSYSYDFSVSEMRKVNAVSHEVVIGARFNNPGKLICPRFLW